MYDREDGYNREDPLAVGRGIAFGLLFGTLIWAGILGAVFYFVWR
jgi:hypothetical protein